ncbi:OPT family oligopeptide transporter [Crateriforma conspicua]|uniref:OPT oligopeptide transporter protein n=1 Tax=Crateriforma conspicua TaxID=2527996 RepID=A0A5C5Y9C5_9PLAN|nr:OPT/YSL family transporter [Crateriforma conspicua]QDV65651.1 OPT oligopeptide transporter protein [Crateriforma conspicua]TWT71051.1 OPT oligopeptide transporter protein [Crateriforma conspicua]
MESIPQPTDGAVSGPARSESYRELTARAVVLGVIQGVILNVAFVYAALKLGFSIGGSTVASIMGYALLRGVFRNGTMVENNINQTIASGINTAGTGVVFTVPALFMLDAAWRADGGAGLEFQVLPLVIAGVAGAVLGVVAIIPLRKQMVELDRLRFPSGVATATIIRAGSTGMEKAKLLAAGFAISALWKLVMVSGWLETPGLIEKYGAGIAEEELLFGFGIIPAYWAPAVYLSLMNMAAGMLAGRSGLPFLLGGLISWWLISPTAVASGWIPADLAVDETAGFIYSKMLRPLGIGVLIGGALMGVVTSFPAIKGAIGSLASATKTAGSGKVVGSDEMKLPVLIGGSVLAMVLFFVASMMTPGVTVAGASLSAIVGTLWLGLAALIVAQATGLTDISPMSGMALISVTLMMFLLNKNIAASMVVGVAVCVAIGQGADMMQDLKTGFLIGARPVKQQLVQFATTWAGPIISLAVIYILWHGGPNGQNGFGEGTALPAPQGGALMGIIDAVNTGNVPIDKYVMGGLAGATLGAAPMSGLGVLVGLAMYLPFSITLGYGLGCLLQMAIQRVKGVAFCEHKLVPFAAGLIVGEALMGIAHAGFSILRAA